jgi:DNA-binding response OmpR family regulator
MPYVMIVDDDEDFASAAATVLRNAGHEVHVELDTESALTDMKQRRPDLVILDVMFPENASAGFELARVMRHHDEKVKAIPVVMLTAVNQRFPLGFSSRDIDDTWLPVDDFVEKPVDFDVLRNRVSQVLQRHRADSGDAAKQE